jgi:hypothetical protein
VAWSRWYQQVDQPCLDRVQSRSKQDRLGVASKLHQSRRPGESVEIWHKNTLHLLEHYRRPCQLRTHLPFAVDTPLTRLNLSPGSYAADKIKLCLSATVPAESTLLTEVNRAIASLWPLLATYEHSELANPTFPPRRRTISGGSWSQSRAVRGPSRTFPTYNIRASVHRYVRLVLCVAKDEASVDIMCRRFCCNFLRKRRL